MITDAPTTTEKATTTTEKATTTTEKATTTTAAPLPLIFTGRGDNVVELDAEAQTRVAVKASHTGSRNFVIWGLDAQFNEVELLVNEIGGYNGTVLLPDVVYLQVEGDGDWTLELLNIDQLPVADENTLTGGGPTVVFYIGDSGLFTIAHVGESNFSVWWYTADETELLVNEIGNYTGTKPVPGGPAVVAIDADGLWSFTPN